MTHKEKKTLRQVCNEYCANRALLEKIYADSCLLYDTVRGSSDEFPYGAHIVRVVGVDRVKEARKNKIVNRLEAYCATAEAAVSLAPPKLRNALDLHYLQGLTWDEVARKLRTDEWEPTADSLRVAARRYLENAK